MLGKIVTRLSVEPEVHESVKELWIVREEWSESGGDWISTFIHLRPDPKKKEG